ncbi:unnamed protein product [Schistocephalus solidus]|uniref:Uncharacterized protein n=1 Tax=Schistocephalus solidus TaxID=70667 RepID=A0A183SFD3_SCHSO|nr:unnamed protein product [Schistocephalus solidus]
MNAETKTFLMHELDNLKKLAIGSGGQLAVACIFIPAVVGFCCSTLVWIIYVLYYETCVVVERITYNRESANPTVPMEQADLRSYEEGDTGKEAHESTLQRTLEMQTSGNSKSPVHKKLAPPKNPSRVFKANTNQGKKSLGRAHQLKVGDHTSGGANLAME